MPEVQELERKLEQYEYRAGLNNNLILIGDTLGLEGREEVFKTVDNIDIYDKRFLPISEKRDIKGNIIEDIIVLRKKGYDEAHHEYLNSVGFGTSKNNVVLIDDGDAPVREKKPVVDMLKKDGYLLLEIKKKMKEGTDYDIHSYHSSDTASDIADRIGAGYTGTSTENSRFFNNKVKFKEFVSNLGIDVSPGTVMYRDSIDGMVKQLEEIIEDYGNEEGKVYVRPAYGASGSTQGIVTKKNARRAAKKLHAAKSSDEFLVETYHDLESSPSVNFRITDEGIYQLNPISGQILDEENEHEGNYYPLELSLADKEQIISQAKKVAEAKQEANYRGDFGSDFIKVRDGPLYLVEDNARVTGAAPGAYLKGELEKRIHKPLISATMNVKIPKTMFGNPKIQNFNQLSDALHGYNCTGTLLFDGERPSAVIPVALSEDKVIMNVFSPTPEGFEKVGKKLGEYMHDDNVASYVDEILSTYK